MAGGKSQLVLRHIRMLATAGRSNKLTDRELVDQYARGRDEEAFAALLRRHGSMILRVYQRVLGHPQDAEDVFQATFLVLARKAATLHVRESIGTWLYEVAYRLAQEARRKRFRQRVREEKASRRLQTDQLSEITARELVKVLDEELNRLAEKYRAPLVLCCLEGRSGDEAARQLACSLSTLKRRLSRGRELLHVRLTRRGLALSTVALSTLLLQHAASASVPAALTDATIKAAMTYVVTGAIGSAVSAKVLALTEGVLKGMFLTKLKIAAAVVMGTVLAAGAGISSFGLSVASPNQSSAEIDNGLRTIPDREKNASDESATKREKDKGPVEEFRAEITSLLINVAPDLNDKEPSRIKKMKAVNALQQDITALIGKYSPKLRPEKGTKKYISKDKAFVLVIAANADGINSTEPKTAEAVDEQAHLVVAIGGDGCPGQFNTNGGPGGRAIAKAFKGVAVAIGGRGGDARFLNQAGGGTGGGGGGGSMAESGVGSIALGGLGGKGFQGGGGGGSGGGSGIINPESIRDAMENKEAFEAFRAELTALLETVAPDLKDNEPSQIKKTEAAEALRNKLSLLIDKYSPKLRPRKGAKRYVSKNKDIVLVIAANADGINIAQPEEAEAIDSQAHLVVAIGGDGAPGRFNTNGESGGLAEANAPKGVAVAIGGRGGDARFLNQGGGGTAGGPGGSSEAQGGIGSIFLGGAGGKGFANGPDGVTGAGASIINPERIRDAMRKK